MVQWLRIQRNCTSLLRSPIELYLASPWLEGMEPLALVILTHWNFLRNFWRPAVSRHPSSICYDGQPPIDEETTPLSASLSWAIAIHCGLQNHCRHAEGSGAGGVQTAKASRKQSSLSGKESAQGCLPTLKAELQSCGDCLEIASQGFFIL